MVIKFTRSLTPTSYISAGLVGSALVLARGHFYTKTYLR